ncbi:MAG: hypothetical protein C4520_16085 [Candidatus Abyssobacteria bacterium SURF_5]|uniref:Uncharacterized protein n=1 Tax=Abyssobacteria bacterium (strain SURF_5) TaxID=2093360 RepID=A0A3A4NH55_ABYX5|nr:MAG: hypothetical protein C4520_16085 [Candidatus Abyssubacteria bacterium SURF_5]
MISSVISDARSGSAEQKSRLCSFLRRDRRPACALFFPPRFRRVILTPRFAGQESFYGLFEWLILSADASLLNVRSLGLRRWFARFDQQNHFGKIGSSKT